MLISIFSPVTVRSVSVVNEVNKSKNFIKEITMASVSIKSCSDSQGHVMHGHTDVIKDLGT